MRCSRSLIIFTASTGSSPVAPCFSCTEEAITRHIPLELRAVHSRAVQAQGTGAPWHRGELRQHRTRSAGQSRSEHPADTAETSSPARGRVVFPCT
uniref:Uncharacterized protein n=1 Tax=Cyanistes caeruleus TaxID=156563 RepID=A0A8C0VJ76_CYACU